MWVINKWIIKLLGSVCRYAGTISWLEHNPGGFLILQSSLTVMTKLKQLLKRTLLTIHSVFTSSFVLHHSGKQLWLFISPSASCSLPNITIDFWGVLLAETIKKENAFFRSYSQCSIWNTYMIYKIPPSASSDPL